RPHGPGATPRSQASPQRRGFCLTSGRGAGQSRGHRAAPSAELGVRRRRRECAPRLARLFQQGLFVSPSAARRSVMKVLLMVAAALAFLAGSLQARADQIEQVTLRLEGVHSDEDGVAIMDALARVPNIKVATRPTPQNPTVILVPLDGAKYDL